MNYQYYPTSEKTTAIMWSMFKKEPTHVCDPSAGKGNLLKFAKMGFPGISENEIPWIQDEDNSLSKYGIRLRERAKFKFANIKKMSAIEIDIQHHASLKELGANIIGYDFLQTESLATVSHVIMNPPFSEGARHVLHAWRCVYDAEIVAIVNAETIKNPFSIERQKLVELIEKHGSVQFLQNQFTDDVERKTDVEVALIYLEKVPAKFINLESIMEGLSVDAPDLTVDVETCNALSLPSNFIHDTCVRFRQAVAAARKASEALAVANRFAAGVGVTLEEMQAKGVGNDFRQTSGKLREDAENDFKERYQDLQKRAWAQIIRSTLITDKISNQARRKLESASADICLLEFSPANIHGFLAGVLQSMGDIYENMVCDLFDTIIERSSDNVVFYKSWKSNQKHKVGMRIRKSRFIIPNFGVTYGSNLRYEDCMFLADIDKVFGYLHGISGPYEGISHAVKKMDIKSSERIETKFFDFRFYPGAGTIHFYPKSEEVVEKINKFVGKVRNWIPSEMKDSNDDFRRQYEDGEKLTKEYSKETKRNLSGVVYQLVQSLKGRSFDTNDIEKMEKAIDVVHEKLGIHCGPALAAPVKKEEAMLETLLLTQSSEQHQLDLLAT